MVDARKLDDVGEAIGKVAERFDALCQRRKDGYLSSDPVPEDKTLRKTDSAAGNYASQLKAAVEDNERFDQIVSRLRADRSITADGMREAAKEFLGYEPKKSKGREALLQDIVDMQRIFARGAARGQVLDRLKPW